MTYYFDVILKYTDIPIDLQNKIRENQYYKIFLLTLVEMFTLPSLNDNTFKLCETMNLIHGFSVLGHDENNNICVGVPEFSELDNDLQPILTGARTLLGKPMKDYYLIRNNSMFMSETSTFKWYTEQLALIDFSQRKLAHKSICNPTVAVEDDELFKQMNEILKNSADKDYEIVRKRPTADTVLNGAPAYDIINLTDISYADKFSYLTSYHLDILSRFYFLYGFSWQAPMKTQYESKDQLNYRDQCCDIYISNMYETRYNDYKKACDGLGIEFNFDFSEQWKRDKVTENDEKGVNDNEHKDISKNE